MDIQFMKIIMIYGTRKPMERIILWMKIQSLLMSEDSVRKSKTIRLHRSI